MKCIYLLLLAVSLWSCSNNENKGSGTDTSTSKSDTVLTKTNEAADLDTVDVYFFQNAAYGGMTEVESSNKVLAVTLDSGVKAFAETMLTDHGNANEKLKALAASKGYTLPSMLPQSKIDRINRMEEMMDEGRNEYYMQLMISEHQHALDLFAQATRSKDSEIREFAKSILPILNTHYQHIQKLYTEFKKPKAEGGDDLLKLSDRKKQKG